jgi:hypothetical protein
MELFFSILKIYNILTLKYLNKNITGLTCSLFTMYALIKLLKLVTSASKYVNTAKR